MNLSKKISIFLIILFFVFSRTNTAKALFGSDVFDIGNPLDIGEAVVDIFMEAVSSVGTQAIEQVTERVGNVNNDFLEDTQENITDNIMPGMLEDIDSEIENSPIYQDLLEAFQQDDLDGMPIYFDVNGDGVIDYLDLGLTDTNGDGIVDASDGSSMSPDNPNYQNQIIISQALDNVMAELTAAGFFEDGNAYGDYMTFTEEQFKLILGNILFRNIITQTVDPNTGLPVGIGIQNQIDFEIKITPSYPQPGDIVQIEVVSNSVNLSDSEITWLMSGKILNSGLGQTNLRNHKINKLGAPEIITVKIQTPNNGLMEKSITIKPAYVDFYYETNTYTPPFYKGKSAFVRQSRLKVIAIPQILDINGNKLSYRDFTYKWYLNNKIIDGKKTGENFVYIQDDYFNNQLTINVVMEHLNSDLLLSKSFNLSPEEPELVIYEEDPALGIKFNKAILNQKSTNDREFSIKVFPFNFNNVNSLQYKWGIDGGLISGVIDSFITFRANGSNDINSIVSVDVMNPINITQSKSRNFNIFVNN